MDNTFRAEAESELELDEMEDSDWEEYGGEIYGKDN